MKQTYRALVAGVFLLLGATLASAYDIALVGQAERAAESMRDDLARISNSLQLPTLTDDELVRGRGVLESVRTQATDLAQSLSGPIEEIGQQIAKLGPPAKEGAEEPAAIAQQRADLTAASQRFETAKRQLEVIAVEAEQVSSKAAALQRDRFLSRVFEAQRSVFSPAFWLDAAPGVSILAIRLAALVKNWWQDVAITARPAVLLLVAFILLLATMAYRRTSAWLAPPGTDSARSERRPSDLAQLWRVVRGVVLFGLWLFLVLVAVSFTLNAAGLSTPRADMLFIALAKAVFETASIAFLAQRVAATGLPIWRLVNLDDAAAARFVLLVGLIALVTSLEKMLSELADSLYLPIDYAVGQSAVTTIVAGLLIALLLIVVRRQPGLGADMAGRRLYFGWVRPLVPILWLVLISAAAALAVGYLALGNFLIRQLYGLSVLASCLYLLHRLAEASTVASLDPQHPIGKFVRRLTGFGERGVERLAMLLRTGFDILLVLIGIPFILIQLTFTWIDFRSFLNSAFLGFEIGGVTIAPSLVLSVALVAALGVVITNIAMRWLDARLLSQTRLDTGVQDSVRKAGTYAGYILTAGLALSIAGLDFSTIAIIAGALGVGIGFGLQSIVNNFISGLILLAERPVRVGDWVALAAGEGLVKKINVRTTQIETFDNCTIIVPNSALITEPVRNWTHADTMGRFLIEIGVGYDCDPDQVKAVLLDLAKQHPKVLTYPEALVVLVGFGTYAVKFELLGHVADIFEAKLVAGDLRVAILRKFRELGIVIPVPQQDIRIVSRMGREKTL